MTFKTKDLFTVQSASKKERAEKLAYLRAEIYKEDEIKGKVKVNWFKFIKYAKVILIFFFDFILGELEGNENQ